MLSSSPSIELGYHLPSFPWEWNMSTVWMWNDNQTKPCEPICLEVFQAVLRWIVTISWISSFYLSKTQACVLGINVILAANVLLGNSDLLENKCEMRSKTRSFRNYQYSLSLCQRAFLEFKINA